MEPMLQLPDGQIKGTIKTNSNDQPFYSFTCIPYGKAPVGNLRFKAPEPVESWTGVKDATKEEHFPFQANLLTGTTSGSEDCLTLHVFTKKLPRDEEKLRPVLVHIHGGGYVIGSHETNMYGPEYLMTEDIVFVGITYRLGFPGFISFNDPSLDVPGNAGLKDQVLALQWVQRNIKFFNGDSNNVTIFGLSAGATSVEYLLISPVAKNLFHKAIMQSGSLFKSKPKESFDTADLAAYLGKPNLSEKNLLKILEEMSVKELYETQRAYIKSKNLRGDLGLIGPVIEKPNPTAILTKEPIEIVQTGEYNSVPIITGFNNQEGALLLAFENMAKAENKDYSFQYKTKAMLPFDTNLIDANEIKKICDTLDNVYGNEDDKKGRILMATDGLFAAGITLSAKIHAKFSKYPVYLYRFSLDTDMNMCKKMLSLDWPGACHGDDAGYFFKSYVLVEIGEAERTAQKKLITLWTNFAKCGNPTPKGNSLNIEWKPVQREQLHFLDIGSEFKMDVNPGADRMKLWYEIYKNNSATAKYVQ